MLVELTEKEFEIVKKVLSEAYDAVTDKNNIKDRKQKYQSYVTRLMKRLKNALVEEEIDSSLTDNGYGLKIGKYKVTLYYHCDAYSDVDEFGKNYIGAESGEYASFSQMENNVKLSFWLRDELVDEKDFDLRNTPSMVKWIINHING